MVRAYCVGGVFLKFLLKLTMASSLAVILGAVSAGVALRFEAQAGGASATSQNPYARAAWTLRDFLPEGPNS